MNTFEHITFEKLINSAPKVIKRKLEQLEFLRERPDYHPESSVKEHIRIVTERLIPLGDPDLILAGVLHDICKFDTVKKNEKTGWPTSPGHDDAAAELIDQDLMIQSWIIANGGDWVTVREICRFHMRFHQLGSMKPAKQETHREQWKSLGIWQHLRIFGAADNMLEEFDITDLEKSHKSISVKLDIR